MPADLPILTVLTATAWSQWLIREAEISTGVWLTLAKKGVTKPTSLTYAHALDEALCHGWIDGQTRSCDDKTYFHRFTPRTKTSSWSKRNVGHIARLEAEGRMYPRGAMEVERAKKSVAFISIPRTLLVRGSYDGNATMVNCSIVLSSRELTRATRDGRWDAAYAGQATMEPPEELSAAIAKDAEVQAMWDGLTKQNRYAFCHRLAVLKTDVGRQKRIAATVESLRRGDIPHPQKQSSAQESRRGTPMVEPAKVDKATRRSTRIRAHGKISHLRQHV